MSTVLKNERPRSAHSRGWLGPGLSWVVGWVVSQKPCDQLMALVTEVMKDLPLLNASLTDLELNVVLLNESVD